MEVDKASVRWTRAAEAYKALEWVIVRDPFGGQPLNGGHVFAQTFEGARSVDMPTVTAVYTVSDQRITVTSVRFEDAKYGQAGTA